MSETLDYLRAFATFPFALRRYLAAPPLTVAQARQVVGERLAQREARFLAMLKRSVYGWPRSPYLALLRHAGCELGDVQALVQRHGLEPALRQLRQAGVYVTFEEYKGRKPIVRPGLNLPVTARDFDNPFARRHFMTQTGGSTGAAAAVGQNLDHIAGSGASHLLLLAAHGLAGAPGAVWAPILPGAGLSFVLRRLGLRQPTPRWFSMVGWRDSRYWIKYSLGTLYPVFWLRVFGAAAPMPQIVRPSEAGVVARWLHQAAREHGRAVLYSSASQALRVALAAEQAGLDMTGVVARTGGEPLTPAKAEAIGRAGLTCLANYGGVETGSLAGGCLHPAGVDDMHLFTDLVALFSFPHSLGDGQSVPAFNVTTLLDSAPKLMLNLQSDDYGVVEERACGCDLEACGYTTHVREVRSYGKLVGEAVTLIGNELARVLEEVLPARFGGSPLDYQLLEQEDENGFTRLYLVIHPRLEIRDERKVIEVVHEALRQASPMADAARIVWQRTQTILIKRMEPMTTVRGKLFSLHQDRRPDRP